ncbi:MAG: hypothetical protein E7187_05495 [Erysipelotrichaceae bacterium]|nr:hypothetical protein [Erysipelotrichaceae bacterium]
MLKIYNSYAVTRKQRFINALVTGIPAALVCIGIFWVVSNIIGVYMPVLFIPAGYLISYVIQRFGKGVQIQFSVLAVILTAAVIIIGDLTTFRNLQMIMLLFTNGVSGLWNIGYRAVALILAFHNSRII